MKKIVKKDGKILEIWSPDCTFKEYRILKVLGEYEEEPQPVETNVVEETTDNEEKIVNKRKKREKS